MKLLSWNVRGLGNPGAKNALRQLLRDEKPDVIFISETKLSKVDFERYCRSCGYANVIAYPSDGASGGVGICWNNSVSIQLLSYDYNYVDVDVLNDGDEKRWRLTGFYGHPEVARRHESWSLLRTLKDHSDLPWLCVGDFNEIMYSYEKRGGQRRNRNQMRAFRDAAEFCELLDIGYHGFWYTWQRGGLNSPLIRCRLDRGLANNAWWELVENFAMRHLTNAHSDHNPLVLSTDPPNTANQTMNKPPPRFCASWVHDEECARIVSSVWQEHEGSVLAKTSAILDELLKWSSKKLGGRKKRKRKLQRKLDRLAMQDPDEAVLQEIVEVKTALNLEIDQEEALWAQRAHIAWLREGDKNTSFFHKSAKHRKRVNTIRSLESGSGNVERTTGGMLKIAVDYFKELFSTTSPSDFSAVLDGIDARVTPDMNENLTRQYTAEEVKDALFSMGPNKASGPDGLSALFYQRFWTVVGDEVTKFCLEFLNGDRDITEINETNVVLIPKVDSPERMQQFRPISLSNVIYKIIAKTLANRFKGVLDLCIDLAQSAFIPGRLISDNVIIAYEMLHTLKNMKKEADGCFALKMDMSKAYDRVEWSYLEAVMCKMGFDQRFVNKIMHCVKGVSYSVIMNGVVSEVFHPSRGIRQGDPLSTYLFLICSEGLSSLLRTAQASGIIQGLKASPNGPAITHLLFADDSIIFGQTSDVGAKNLRDIIYAYGACSGQRVNYDKSLIYFSANSTGRNRAVVKSALRVRVESNPKKYLGLPSMVGRDKTASFQYLRDKISERINGWSTRFLSQAGKEVFIKAVLQSLPTYAMGCFLLPRGLCRKMNELISKYWWRGVDDSSGMYWSTWDKVCKPKNQGGLGFRDLATFNIAMLAKQGWQLITKPESLVAQVLKAKYYPSSSFLEARIGRLPSLTWRSIWSSRGLLEKGICWRVGNGLSIRAYCDVWLPGLPAKIITPLSGRINPIARATEFIDLHTMQWKEQFMRETLPGDVVDQLLFIPLPLSPIPDTVAWQYSNTGIYTVSSGYHVLNGSHRSQTITNSPSINTDHSNFYKRLWKVNLPPKVLHAIWKIYKGYNSTMQKLFDKYIAPSPLCPRCSATNETSEHTFRECSSFNQVWSLLQISWDTSHDNDSMQEWLRYMLNKCSTRDIQKVFLILWANWSNRNKLIHEGLVVNATQLAFYVERYLLTYENARTSPVTTATAPVPPQRWESPPHGYVAVNFDASYESNNNQSYSGIVIRDGNGEFKAAASILLTRISTPFAAEAMACLHAIQVAWSFGHQNIILQGDSLAVVKRVKSDEIDRSPIGPIVSSCKSLLSDFRNVKVKHIKREMNVCAHTVANERRRLSEDKFWIDERPDFLHGIDQEEVPM